MLLKQKEGWAKREFELLKNDLRVKYKDGKGTKEYTVPLEEIGRTKFFNAPSQSANFISAAFFIGFAIVTTTGYLLSDGPKEDIIWIILANAIFLSIGAACIFLRGKEEIHLTGGNTTISFFANSPSRSTVNDFIDKILSRNKEIILKKYAKVDPDLPEETQMNQLYWLKTREFITESEYEGLKNEYRTKKLL